MATTHTDENLKEHDSKPSPDNHGRNEHEQRVHQHKDELLDNGVEETFPASDPVAVKHIT